MNHRGWGDFLRPTNLTLDAEVGLAWNTWGSAAMQKLSEQRREKWRDLDIELANAEAIPYLSRVAQELFVAARQALIHVYGP